MATVGDLVDRAYRDSLAAADDQPARIQLEGSVDSTQATLVWKAGLLAPDEEEVLAPGIVVEFGQEQVYILASDLAMRSLTVVRGFGGTTAQAHSADALGTISPLVTRQTVFDAVADNVVALYPALYRTETSPVTIGQQFTEADSHAETAVDLWYQDGSRWCRAGVRLVKDFAPSFTGRALFTDAPAGKAAHFTYRARFTRPTAESENLLDDLGVEDEWERVVLIGTLSQVLAGRDLETLSQEFVTEQVAQQNYPPGMSTDLSAKMYRYYRQLLDDASKQLRTRDTVPVEWTDWRVGR